MQLTYIYSTTRLTLDGVSISAISVRFDDAILWVGLTNRRTLGVPLAWFPRLLPATPAQRAELEISRVGLH